ncbi:glycosyl hydrolase family 8 [Sulfobacillus thermosulfidooxidans]|uniref:glycosyl hydrolase family 8 n=1 Tax=Sulfobacillus thermosulfidooxidans TaxID=28034 RepID=UPI00096B73A0|nr:glycosyl hydrolase family 8 [Sulfobacillus thermosulfidooxidans]OLZ11202.1 hypothetical protein BFX05_07940 [Sulfobacillus thermosulfidooxidans]OLZ13459.1 hypothetical protein BFX06_09825 [Sulfobacillus thermosulfidooxidans]OLZ21706.1 hypothetical protein BFX07_12875 [Sulfobacillus thermosulfidooxidans]
MNGVYQLFTAVAAVLGTELAFLIPATQTPVLAATTPPISDWTPSGTLSGSSTGIDDWSVTVPYDVPVGDIVDVEIHENGEKVWQTWFTAGGSHWSGIATVPEGTATLDVGIFQPNWSSLDGWWNNLAMSSSSTSLPPISQWTMTGTLSASSNNTTAWSVTAPYNVPVGDVVDVEIHENGEKVWQTWFSAGGSHWSGIATVPEGTATLDVGIFQPNWSSLDGWWNNLSTDEISEVGGSSSSVATAASLAYQSWQQTYVQSAGPGLLRVVRPQNNNDTVSEGIGYGMLLAVANNDLATFQGLWNYAKKYRDASGLMNWDISASGTVIGTGSATDADEDMAYALFLAHQRWPGQGFGQAATNQIDAILAFDVSPHNRLLPGDHWGDTAIMNPSYIAPAYYARFATFTGNNRWNLVAEQNLQWIADNANPTTGLLPDWLNADGSNPAIPWDQYSDGWYYDAVRLPWRLWLAASSQNNTLAQTVLQEEGHWLEVLNTTALTSGYTLEGIPLNNYQSGPFISAAAFMAQYATPALAKAALTQLEQWQPHTYYGASLRALALATFAGELNG